MTICGHQPVNKADKQRAAEKDHKIGCVKGKNERCGIVELVGRNQQLNTEKQIKPGDCDQYDLPDPPVGADFRLFFNFLNFLWLRFIHSIWILILNNGLSILFGGVGLQIYPVYERQS